MTEHTLHFAAATMNAEAALEVSRSLSGIAYVDARETAKELPFRGLVVGVTDDMSDLEPAADFGTYIVCQRVIKPGSANVYGLFPLIHHPDKTHVHCDAHWRDVHAPLALEHHAHMTHYIQLSVVHRLSGTHVDGFALCGFDSEDDLRNRFFTTDESRQVIADDIQKFANVNRSPRRLIATPNG